MQFFVLGQDTIPSDTVVIVEDTVDIVIIEPDLTLPDELPIETIDTVNQESFIKQKFFSGLEIGIDYPKFLGLLVDFETKYEGFIGLIFRNRYTLSIEAGKGNLSPQKAYKNDILYESEGIYGRIGLNYILANDEKNSLTAGVRFGHSNFKEVIEYKIENPFGFICEDKIIRDNLFAQWYELTLTTESALFKNLYAGAIFRFRILGRNNEIEPFKVYSIPGYGRAFDKTIPALNLYFKYRLNI